MKLSSIFQFILGFILGIVLLGAGAAGAAFLLLAQMNSNPPKPVFSEEKPKEPEVAKKPEATPKATEKPVNEVKTEAPKPEPQKPKEEEKLEPGAYKASVTWSDGLSIRSEPSKEGERIGGVGYNEELIILSTSPDGDWQKVRIPGTQQEGWVRAGNVKKAEAESSNN